MAVRRVQNHIDTCTASLIKHFCRPAARADNAIKPCIFFFKHVFVHSSVNSFVILAVLCLVSYTIFAPK